jgi:hypothetical protein
LDVILSDERREESKAPLDRRDPDLSLLTTGN